jgi:hypothetical protein
MHPRPSFDHALLILIAIGVVSILGTGWIFSTGNLGKSLITPTAIPSSFSSLEAGTLTPSPSALPIATGTSPDAYRVWLNLDVKEVSQVSWISRIEPFLKLTLLITKDKNVNSTLQSIWTTRKAT